MASVTDCLAQLQKLTRQNLDILQAINDAFLSDKTYLTANIGDVKYAIPSFTYLESKINNLEENFNNLINAPKTGEAYFNFNGNSRSIEVRGYTHTPNSLILDNKDTFEVENNDIFKDFLTPVPYISFSLKELPNDITSVNIKKIIPKTQEVKDLFISILSDKTSSQYTYADMYKKLYIYEEDKDYVEYDTVKKLPIRKNIGSGTYVIGEIKSDTIDENLDEYITIQFRSNIDAADSSYTNKLTYKLFDETIERSLKIGDELVTYDDSAKLIITELQQNTNTVVVRVENGEYLNLVEDKTNTSPESISDLAKLKFYSPIDFNEDKIIKVPLEEDQYIFIAIAPLNDRMNIQSSWGTGLVINTFELTNGTNNFQDYYKKNVKNIGDTLNELMMLSPGELTKLSEEDFESFTKQKPEINTDLLSVVQINKHLNDTATVKNIKALYTQKLKYTADLQDIQNKITAINDKLSKVSFDDTSNIKTVYTQQLTEYNKTKSSLVTSLQKIMDEISLAATSSDIPIENAKYHIRGFFDYKSYANNINISPDHIKGIRVQYRYKNLDKASGNATTIAENYLFSDWSEMKGFLNTKEVSYDNGYQFNTKEDTSNQNVPSFNQIDIAISQGETVDIRLQVIYDYGYPYAEVTSAWSDIVNIEFPQEFLKDVQVLDIISENNSDIETNRFNNILNEQGVIEHIEDKIQDQDITYYHKPENISSGFYTSERRVIPLKDKLTEFSNLLTQLKDEVAGTNSSALSVSVGVGDISNKIYPLQSNNILVEGYNDLTSQVSGTDKDTIINNYTISKNIVSTLLNVSITNNSEHAMKLYPMFPGSSNEIINNKPNYKYNAAEYTLGAFVSSGDISIRFNQLQTIIDNLRKANDDDHNQFRNDISLLYSKFKNEGFDSDREYVTKQTLNVLSSSIKAYTSPIEENQIKLYNMGISGDYMLYYFWTPPVPINDKDYVQREQGYINDVSLKILISTQLNDNAITRLGVIGIQYNVYIEKLNGDNIGNKQLNDKPIIYEDFNNPLVPIISSAGAGSATWNNNEISDINVSITSFNGRKFNFSNLPTLIIGKQGDKEFKLSPDASGIEFTLSNTELNSIKSNTPITLNNKSSISLYSDDNSSNVQVLENSEETENDKGVWMRISGGDNYILQRCNQFMNFRTSSIIGTTKYYNENPSDTIYGDNNLSGVLKYIDLQEGSKGATLYPCITNEKSLICNNIGTISYQLLNPGDTIVIPMLLKYKLETIGDDPKQKYVNQVSKTISFDLLPSLYQDPINYEFTVTCKYQLTDQDRALMNNRKYTEDVKYTTTVTK